MFFKKKKKAITSTIEITEVNFSEYVLQTEKGVLLDFWAPWCGPCKVMGPIIDEVANEIGDKAVIGKVNVDQHPQLSAQFKIKSIPTLVFIKKRKVIEQISGLVPKPNLSEMVNDLIAYEFDEEE